VISGVDSGTITTSSAIITWTTNELSNSRVDYGPDTSLDENFETDSTMTKTHSVELTSLTAIKKYYYNVTSCDADNTSLCTRVAGTAFTTKSGGSSGGGGGGGSSSSGSSTSASTSLMTSYDQFLKGSTTLSFNSNTVFLTDLIITTNAASPNVRFVIANLDAAGSQAKYVGASVYQYIEINHTNLNDSVITGAKVRFKVEKSWLTSNNKVKEDVVLVRYSGTWTPLTTRVLNDDATYVYFEADSPGLSLFAISTKAPATVITPPENIIGDNTAVTPPASDAANTPSTPATEPSPAATPATPQPAAKSYTGLIVVIVIVVIIVAIVLMMLNAKKKKHKV
jgi:PGF-pre-PGF domain-containing protein